ncbi:hypothetical protein OKW43_002241 [Paraburkholderia sp. WC7.3g]|uniref:hypothetical protein n=1 Tax=Paraburkholderia sp. WC7.3g TaxID=2991070 RepID=UPI003D24264B
MAVMQSIRATIVRESIRGKTRTILKMRPQGRPAAKMPALRKSPRSGFIYLVGPFVTEQNLPIAI